MKKEKMCFSGQRDKKESALGMNSIKSVDIVSNHLTWTPEGIDHPILKDITLTLEQGHIYGIIGPNGAGKSSFLRHVLAFLKTESKESMKIGDVSAADYSRKKLARLLSFVPQKTDLETDFTAEEIVMTGRTPYQGRFLGTSVKICYLKRRRKTKDCDCTRSSTNHTLDAS